MTIKNLYPQSRPRGIYNVINGRPELPANNIFSRASIASYTDSNGFIDVADPGVPRFNYNPITGEFLGLLLEDSSENVLLGSNSSFGMDSNFNTYFSTSTSSVTSAQSPLSTSPIGGQARRLFYNGYNGGGSSGIPKEYTPPSVGSTVSFSYYVRVNPANLYIVGLMLRTYSRDPGNNEECTAKFNFKLNKVTQVGGAGATKAIATMEPVGNDWYRITMQYERNRAQATFGFQLYMLNPTNDVNLNDASANGEYVDITAPQAEYGRVSTWIPTTATAVTREADQFSLTSSSNFDNGFSLLLDSETTTEDYIYRIKASGTTISELKNNNGTLEWEIGDPPVSAQTEGRYPQVGFTSGRVRTVSSFGAADGTIQNNYLYTTGLSFPTPAVVAPGADELKFGVPQSLKAVYLWDGQLNDTEAVSVIKGEYNVVPIKPISGTAYSFIYNTDPNNNGNTQIVLPYIVPTVSMVVDWGDGQSDSYSQGVLAQHTYPYPGEYRIQIEADDGFDLGRLGDNTDTIKIIDQWAPQYRVGASGPGFTDDKMKNLLVGQLTLDKIPPFKYSNITSLSNAFNNCNKVLINNWDWVPYQLENCTELLYAFNACTQSASDTTDALRISFPQLKTTGELTNVSHVFANSNIRGYKDELNNPTNQPFTNSENVTDWTNAFANCRIESLSVDTQSAISLSGTFQGNSWVTSPFFSAPNCTNFSNMFQRSYNMTTLNSSISLNTYDKGTDFQKCFNECKLLTDFPVASLPAATQCAYMFLYCEALTTTPMYDAPLNTSCYSIYDRCSNLTSIDPGWNMPLVTDYTAAFRQTALIEIPSFSSSNVDKWYYAFYACPDLVTVGSLDYDSTTTIRNMFSGNCTNLANLPFDGTFVFPVLESARTTFTGCSSLANFPPNAFDSTGPLETDAFEATWQNNALTAQSIENILVSLDTNGQSNIVLGIDGGTNAAKSTWSAAANTAYDNLITKGWTIEFNA